MTGALHGRPTGCHWPASISLDVTATDAVEDSRHGVSAAVGAGTTTVGYRAANGRDVDRSHADLVVEGPEALGVALLERR